MHISHPILISGPTAHPNCSVAAEKERLRPRRMSTWSALADAHKFLNHNASWGVCLYIQCMCVLVFMCVCLWIFCDCWHNQICQMFLCVWLSVLMCFLIFYPVCFRCVFVPACMCECMSLGTIRCAYKRISLCVLVMCVYAGWPFCHVIDSERVCVGVRVCVPRWVGVLLCGSLLCSPPPHNLGNSFLIFPPSGE